MIKRIKKGFTIVELVIVIAVIAILSAVLIPTFSNVIKSANESADTQLVRNLNTAVTIELSETGKTKASTADEALGYAKNNGYDVSVIVAKSDNNIAWSRDTGAFVLIDTTKKTAIYPTTNGTNELNVVNGGQASVHTYGNVGFATVTKGKLVAEEGKVQAAYIPDSSATVTVNENGGEVTIVYVKVESDKTTVVENNKTNVEANEVVYLFDADHASEADDAAKVAAAVEAKAEEASLNAGNDVALAENPDAVCRIGSETFDTLADMVSYVLQDSNEGKTITVSMLNDAVINGSLFFDDISAMNLIIEGNNHTITNSCQYSGSALTELLGIVAYTTGSDRASITVNNLTINSPCNCFYAADKIDMTLNNCNGTSSSTNQTKTGWNGYYNSAIAASDGATLTVNGGTFVGHQYGAYVYNTGATMKLTDCNISVGTIANSYVLECDDSTTSTQSKMVVESGTYSGTVHNTSGITINGGTFDSTIGSNIQDNRTK